MEGTGTKVNDQMKGSQKVAGFDYSDFESSMINFDSSFQVRPLSCRSPCVLYWPVLNALGQNGGHAPQLPGGGQEIKAGRPCSAGQQYCCRVALLFRVEW